MISLGFPTATHLLPATETTHPWRARRHLWVALMGVLLVEVACAHGGALLGTSRADLAAIDVIDGGGHLTTLSRYRGRRIVLDLCAAWSTPCMLNAKALDEVCRVRCGDEVAVVSILLDEIGEPARQGYRDVMGFRHDVYLPGPAMRQGRSPLGDVSVIPRLLIIGPEGNVEEDIRQGVVSAARLLERLPAKASLPRR